MSIRIDRALFDERTPGSWLEQAIDNLEAAENVTSNQIKARHAMEAAELALKALLIKRSLFTPDEYTHDLKDLYEKLRQNGAFQSPQKVEKLVDQIEPVQAYDEAQNTYVDICSAGQVPNIRYPFRAGLQITDSMAQQKLTAAKQLVNIVKHELTR